MTIINIPLLNDTYMSSGSTGSNYSTEVNFYVGENKDSSSIYRAWIKPDFSTVPASIIFVAATLYLTVVASATTNERIMYLRRCLQAAVNNQITWNVFSSGNNWGTAGASNSTTDYDGSVIMGQYTVPAASSGQYAIQLSAPELQKLYDGTYTNNGIVLFMATQSNDASAYASINNATEAYRPYIQIRYDSFIPGAIWF